MPNIFDRLYNEAKKKKQQLEQQVARSAVADLVNPNTQADQQRRVSRGLPSDYRASQKVAPNTVRQIVPETIRSIPKVARATGLAAQRSVVDIGQAGSGVYDLATPGTGTSRFSKKLDQTAKNIDATAKREGVNPAYRIMQAPLSIATFAAPGGVLKAAGSVPKLAKFAKPVTKATAPINRAVTNTANKVAQKGAGGRIAGQALRTGATPAMAANAVVGTGYDLGLESGKGRDISKQDVAISAGANTALPFAMGAGGQAAIEGARKVAPTVVKASQNVQKARSGAVNRQAEDKGARQERRQLESEIRQIDGRLNALPPTPQNAQQVNALLIKRDTKRGQLKNIQGAQRTNMQKVTDKLLTAQPGMSMKAVNPDSAPKGGKWTTPLPDDGKRPPITAKDTNGVTPQEGDVIEFSSVLGDANGKSKTGRATVNWQGPYKANASGKEFPGQWIGNGALEGSTIPFTIVKRGGKSAAPSPSTTPASKLSPDEEIRAIYNRANQNRGGKLTMTEEKRIAGLQGGQTTAPKRDRYSVANSDIKRTKNPTMNEDGFQVEDWGGKQRYVSFEGARPETRTKVRQAEAEYEAAKAASTGPVAPGTVGRVQVAKEKLNDAYSDAIEDLKLQEYATTDSGKRTFNSRYNDWLETKYKDRNVDNTTIKDMAANPQKYRKQFEAETATASPKATPPPQLPVDPPKAVQPAPVMQPEGKPSRFANTTVQNSDEVSLAVKKLVKAENASYTPTTNKGRVDVSESSIAKAKSPDDFMNQVINDFDTNQSAQGQHVSNAIALAKKFDSMDDEASQFKATELYDMVSRRLTERGQEVQAGSLLNSRTPEGLRYMAQKQLSDPANNVKGGFNDIRQRKVKQLIEAVRKAGGNPEAENLARYRLTKYLSDQVPTSTADKLVNLWRAGLLTAPTTTGGNILGNTGETAVRKGFVNPVASAVDAAISLRTGKRTIANAGGFTRGAKEGTAKLPQFIKTGYDERNALSKYDAKETNYGDSPVGKLLTNYVNGTYRLMSVADQPFWYGARTEALQSMAKAEAITRKLKGSERQTFIKDFVNNPPVEALERATNEAKYSTFQNKTALGSAATGLKKPLGAVGDFVVPFSQVPASIATRIVTRTPVGTAVEVVKQLKSGQFDQRAMSQAIAEGSFGPAVFGAGYALANSGLLTFGYPKDSKERELWEAEGKQPYSVKVGDRWYSLNYLQPFGTLLSIGGEAAKAVKDGADVTETVSRGLATAGQSVMNQSFLKGVSGILDAVSDPQRYAESYVSNTAGSIVPNFVRSAARAGDAVQRDTGDAITGIKQAIPGLRQTTPAKQDMFGGDVPAKDTFANQFLNPLRPSKDRSGDPVSTELRRLLEVDNGILPTAATKTSFKDIKLDDAQVRAINKAAGPAMKAEYQKLITSDAYKALSDEDKAKALKKVNSTVFGSLKAKYGVENSLVADAKLNTNQKRYLKGDAVDFLSSDNERTFAEEYEAKVSDFKKNGNKLSPVERVKKQREIERLNVQKDYDKDTVGLYGLGKADIYDLVSTDKSGQAMAEKLLAYGDAMEAAGLGKNKLRDSKGNVAIKPKEKGSGGGSGGRNARGIKPSDFVTPYTNLIQSTTKGASLARNAKLARKRA